MAIPDLLWTCPFCAGGTRLRRARRADVCDGCATRFRRAEKSSIAAERADGSTIRLAAVDWLDRLPPVDSLLEAAGPTSAIREARVRMRAAAGERAVRVRGEYLGRYEVYEEPRTGVISLARRDLRFLMDSAAGAAPASAAADPGRTGGAAAGDSTLAPAAALRIPLDSLTAVQASSSTLQLKRRRMPVLSLRFLDDSIRLWESLLQLTIQRLYDERGRGTILEFQPRITTGPPDDDRATRPPRPVEREREQ